MCHIFSISLGNSGHSLLSIVGRNMLRAFGHPLATCCDVLDVVGSNLTIFKLSQQHPAFRNTTQHAALACCDRLAGALGMT